GVLRGDWLRWWTAARRVAPLAPRRASQRRRRRWHVGIAWVSSSAVPRWSRLTRDRPSPAERASEREIRRPCRGWMSLRPNLSARGYPHPRLGIVHASGAAQQSTRALRIKVPAERIRSAAIDTAERSLTVETTEATGC